MVNLREFYSALVLASSSAGIDIPDSFKAVPLTKLARRNSANVEVLQVGQNEQ
jgi:hypothetical protein